MTFNNINDLLQYCIEHPDDQDALKLLLSTPQGASLWKLYGAKQTAEQSGDWREYQGVVASTPGVQQTPEQTQWLNNQIANQNTEEARGYETEMRDTSLTSAAQQLQGLGLSASGVLQTGGVSTNGIGAAASSMENPAKQMALEKYQQKMSIVRQLLGMTSSMASAGIYGSALQMARKASGVVAASTANSGLAALQVTKKLNKQQRAQVAALRAESAARKNNDGTQDMSDFY